VKNSNFFIIISVFLIIITINPYTETYMSINPIPYMLAHYSLYASGILLAYFVYDRLKPLNKYISLVIGIFLAVTWHIPFFFNLGVYNLWIRLIEELSLFIGGYFMGHSIKGLSRNFNLFLLALWMIADTYLSALLMIYPSLYTTLYNTQSLQYLGVIMFLMMNTLVVYLLLQYVIKIFKEEKMFI